ncbi:MAG: hypothetical protein AB7G47_13155 [Mycolicibacterium sp.]|uniref:hypothetical protein n=1 Tax=Mycolicibacterium sp. TaxID=2320850 RepID=UPI003D0E3D11
MNASTRAALTTGAAALSLGALAVTASVPPESMRTIQVVRPATFAADIVPDASGAPVEHPSEEDLDSALALIEQLTPVANGRVVTVTFADHENPGTVTIAPAPAPAPGAGAAARAGSEVAGGATVEGPVANNAASDVIDAVYSVSRYWANYVSLELGPWLINWLPFGYLISDQIYIWYPDFVLPTVDSFVYDFLDPVVNDPLNPTVWIDGIGAMLNTAANGVIKGISDEITYIVTFGWFPIPLPPLPDFPLPGLASASASSSAAPTVDDPGIDGTEATDTASTDGTDAPEGSGTTAETPLPAETGTVGEEADDATGVTSGQSTGEGVDGSNEDAGRSAGDSVDEPVQESGATNLDESVTESEDDSEAESAAELDAAESGATGQADDDARGGSDTTPDTGDTDGNGSAAETSASSSSSSTSSSASSASFSASDGD